MSLDSPHVKTCLSTLTVLVALTSGSLARADRLVTLDRAYALALRSHPSILLLQERVRPGALLRVGRAGVGQVLRRVDAAGADQPPVRRAG